MMCSQAFFLGIVQGITEFVPVSSSAHLSILKQLLKIPYQGKAFDVFLNIGSLLAIIVFFKSKMYKLLIGAKDLIIHKKTNNRYLFATVFLSSLPVIIIFGILEIFFTIEVDSMMISSIAMILFAAILYFCDRCPERKKNILRKDSILVGIAQMLSFFPGVSRLGICMSMMRYLTYSREKSFEYSMILSVPPVTGACFIKLIKIFTGQIATENVIMIITGCFSSFVFGLISLILITKFLQSHTLLPIVIYRILFVLFVWFY